VDTAEWEHLGLYDPDAADAPQRRALLEYLVEQGASLDDLVAFRDWEPGLASVLALRGGAGVTIDEVVERSPLDREKVTAFVRAAGLPVPGPAERVLVEDFVNIGQVLAAAEELFGEDVVLQLVRVMGAAMSRVADAVVSAFLVNVEPPARREDNVGLGVARANTAAAELIPSVTRLLEVLLRQHVIGARRHALEDDVASGYEVQQICVGFVDLVDSTALARTLSAQELGALLNEFEVLATDRVVDGGGRVVKLIGDEILFTAPTLEAGAGIALGLAQALADHPRLPQVRCGLAAGAVSHKDGDVFGPVVNLAARVVREASPGQVLVAGPVLPAGFEAARVGSRSLKGFGAPVDLYQLSM
jgi:adenylate cyclase